jgi:hypothetical protein
MTVEPITILNFFVGLVVLLWGRRLFWLLVGGVGFLLGAQLAGSLLGDQEQWVILLAALAAGVLGAVIAVFLERIAFALVGLLAGAGIALEIVQQAGWQESALIAAVVGGAVGLVAALLLTDWAIVVLSALVGAAALVSVFAEVGLDEALRPLVFIALAVVGVWFQGRQLRKTAPHRVLS